MVANPPPDPTAAQGHTSIAWPVDVLLSEADGSEAGYLMPRISGAYPILDLYNPGARCAVCPLFSYKYLFRTAQNLAAVMHALHARDYVIGDVNESNILVTDTALITIVDTDSFQVPDVGGRTVFHCPVGKPEFTPPELQGTMLRAEERTPLHDCFGLGVLIFQLLMEGAHPFAGIYNGEDDPPPIEARITEGHYPYGQNETPYRPTPFSLPIEIMPAVLRRMFQRCFEDGHKDPRMRPHATEWVQALKEAELDLDVCGVNDQHLYGSHLNICPWCQRTEILGGADPFPSKLRIISGRHMDPLPRTTQTALPSATAPSIEAAVAAMPPPVQDGSPIDQQGEHPITLRSGLLMLKSGLQRLTSRCRDIVERFRGESTARPSSRRITYVGRAASSGSSTSDRQASRSRLYVILVVLALAIAAVTVSLKHLEKSKNITAGPHTGPNIGQ
jgi:DNA-binding helix-hairpin-helix protein with protein kinase domain